MRNILFLDIDGVLNMESESYMTAKHNISLLEKHLVQRLNYLCEKAELIEIVVSSTWRFTMDDLKETMKKEGFKHCDKIIGRTTIARSEQFLKRGEQIRKYLVDTIDVNFKEGVDANVFILDDEMYGIEEYWGVECLHPVDRAEGLSNKTVLDLISKCNQRKMENLF